jgi:hypothetical protein
MIRLHKLEACQNAETQVLESRLGELYVFTVTSTSVTEDASWSIGAPYKMVVVSK